MYFVKLLSKKNSFIRVQSLSKKTTTNYFFVLKKIGSGVKGKCLHISSAMYNNLYMRVFMCSNNCVRFNHQLLSL